MHFLPMHTMTNSNSVAVPVYKHKQPFNGRLTSALTLLVRRQEEHLACKK